MASGLRERSAGLVVALFLLLAVSGIARAQQSQSWPHDGGYMAEIDTWRISGNPGGHILGPANINRTFQGFSQYAVFQTEKVTFGPFLIRNDQALNGAPPDPSLGIQGTGFPQTFTIAVLARTPMAANGNPTMTQIGGATITLQPGQNQTFYVAATLPGGLSAVDLQWEVTGPTGGANSFVLQSFISPDCATLDAPCLQGVINPVAMALSVAPLTILYEPPGSCSYAGFTANNVQGTTIAIDQADYTSDGTLNTIPNANTQTTVASSVAANHTADNMKSNQMAVALGVTIDTVQGGSSPPSNCASRTTGGPGHGDVFMILDNAPLVYWNTGNLSSSRFAISTSDPSTNEQLPTGITPEVLIFTADQLQANAPGGLPGTIGQRTQADRNAILGLDAEVTLGAATSGQAATTVPFVPLPLPRYAQIPSLYVGASPNLPYIINETSTDTQADAVVIKNATDMVNSTMVTNGGDNSVESKLFQDAFSTSASGLANTLAGAGGTAISASLGGVGPEFSWASKEVSGYLDGLVNANQGATTKTTIQTTLTTSNTVNAVVGGGSVQNVFIRDPNRTLNVQLYWDQLFGTIAYQEVPAAMGTVALSLQASAAAAMKPLAHVAWIKTIVTGQSSSSAFPLSIAEQLSAVAGGGSFTLVPIPSASFTAHSGFLAGIPSGVTVGQAGLAGTTNATPAVYQQAFFIVDAAGNQDGVFWQTIAVAASNAAANAMCSSEPNSASPGTAIVTCCSLAGICDSFVTPTSGLTTHLEAESNSGRSQVTKSTTDVTATADGAYIKFSAVDFGPFASLIGGFRARALPSAVGQKLDVWVDGPTAAVGGTQLGELLFDGPIQNCAGSWADRHQTRSTTLTDSPSGPHDLYVVFHGPAGESLDWIELTFEVAPSAGPRVQYRPGDPTQPSDNSIQPWITVLNDGSTDMKLNNLSVRYWYTIDTGAPQTVNIDYAAFGMPNVSATTVGLSLPMQQADQTLNVTFPNATCFVPPAGTSGEIHVRVNKNDWSNYNESNDYSYVANRTAYADNMSITAYVAGKLVWGMEPAAVPGAETASSGLSFHVQYRVGDPGQPGDNAIKPQFVIFNDNTVSIPLSQLTLRYWFTAESNVGSQFWCDYALVGNQNVTGNIVTLASPVSGANRYVQVGFSSGAGALYPLGSSGEIQTRISPTDWSNYNELDDYSYNAGDTSFANWLHVTLYRNGTLVWGTEP